MLIVVFNINGRNAVIYAVIYMKVIFAVKYILCVLSQHQVSMHRS